MSYQEIDTFLRSQGGELGTIAEVSLPLRYAAGVAQEIFSLTQNAAILEAKAFSAIRFRGPDAAKFLQGMVSNDIRIIEMGQIQPNLISNNRGKILVHIDIFRSEEEEYLVLTDPSQGPYVQGHLEHFHIREDLEIESLTPDFLRCDVLGPQAEETLFVLGYNREFPQWTFEDTTIVTGSFPLGKVPRFINLVPQKKYLSLLKTLHERPHTAFVGFEAFHQVRVNEGIPWPGIDYTPDRFPQEASLRDHISYTKGCYIGQETHARMYHRGHPNWKSVGLDLPAELELQAGQTLFEMEEEVGKVTSISRIQKGGRRKGIAFLKYKSVQKKALLGIDAVAPPEIVQFPLITDHEP